MRPRVLLLFPGSEGASAGNFGVPQLVGLAGYLRARAGADVTVVDLVCERALGRVDFPALFEGPTGAGYDVIGLSCYSSFDYLPLVALAEIARRVAPRAVIVAGGYHVSARPGDFVFEGSPFDVAVVGEGERPLAEVVASVVGGEPMRGRVLGPDPIAVLDELPETDWSVLARYRGVARRVASQVEVYLSRGCPFDCAFCMEKAKREVSWRGYSVDRAIAELEALHAFLGVDTWTVYFADALFGMPKAWRRAFLEKLAECNFPSLKNWLLIRVDMVDDEDLRLFQAANCSPGFGLESGDPGMLSIIRKAGRLHDYLDRMLAVAERAAELEVPWGANVIVGHPGETEESLRSSAAYMRRLFLGPARTTGFLSVDPFRYYPGSPIDDERGQYEARFGTVVYRPEWWRDGDQAFLSQWVDPSRDLSYLRCAALMESEFAPILREAPARFDYRGPSRPYFLRALQGQIEQFSSSTGLAYLDRYYAWKQYTGRGASALAERADDTRLASLCADLRRAEIEQSEARHGPFEPAIREALVAVRRELHAPLDAVRASVQDRPLALDRSGAATVSALHAYARTFALAGVREGARVLDLGAGTGYGTALLARLVGPTGYVRGVELDPQLVAAGRLALGERANAELVVGSAFSPAAWEGGPWDVVVVGFCADELPELWCAPETLGQATLVAPLRDGTRQRLFRVRRATGVVLREALDEVVYVPARHVAPAIPQGAEIAQEEAAEPGRARPNRTRLPLA